MFYEWFAGLLILVGFAVLLFVIVFLWTALLVVSEFVIDKLNLGITPSLGAVILIILIVLVPLGVNYAGELVLEALMRAEIWGG